METRFKERVIFHVAHVLMVVTIGVLNVADGARKIYKTVRQ